MLTFTISEQNTITRTSKYSFDPEYNSNNRYNDYIHVYIYIYEQFLCYSNY